MFLHLPLRFITARGISVIAQLKDVDHVAKSVNAELSRINVSCFKPNRLKLLHSLFCNRG